MHARMYVCMHACMYACMHACMQACMCVFEEPDIGSLGIDTALARQMSDDGGGARRRAPSDQRVCRSQGFALFQCPLRGSFAAGSCGDSRRLSFSPVKRPTGIAEICGGDESAQKPRRRMSKSWLVKFPTPVGSAARTKSHRGPRRRGV